jgi:hypothetical protein
MADTLLDVVRDRFAISVDRDSDGGRILGSLTPRPPFAAPALTGTADVAPLAFGLTAQGVSVRAADATDSFVLSLPTGPIAFRLIPADAAHPAPQVELTLQSLSVPCPGLRPALVQPNGSVQESGGEVRLQFPDLLLVVTATAATPATAALAPAHGAAGHLVVTMTPPTALVGPGTVVLLTFDQLRLNLAGAGGSLIEAPVVRARVTPPGMPALAVQGGGQDVRFGLAAGDGLSGTFDLAADPSPAATAARPRFLHDLAGGMHLERNTLTSLKLSGKVDLGREIQDRGGGLAEAAAMIRYELTLTLGTGWHADLTLRPDGDGDWLWRSKRQAGASPAREVLGAFAAFAPLLAEAPLVAAADGYATLGLAGAAAAGLAGSTAVTTRSVVLHGAELAIHDPDGPDPQAFLLFDLETEIDLTTGLLNTTRPVKVRHKAIGLRLDFGSTGSSPRLDPVFDPGEGFALDLSDPGLLKVPGPLGDILQPTGARVAKENPVSLDVDLALKADLGIVRVDQAGVRLPLQPAGPPVLTALGAHVDVASAFTGGGYLKLEQSGGFTGRLDMAIAPPLGLRASAGLAIRPAGNETGVLVTMDVGLPVPIPIANSGLGLFGFLGLVGVHYERDQDPPKTALDWFRGVGGDATGGPQLRGWRPAAHRWAFGIGAVIGTVEGGFLFHAKGMVVIEAPGPRVLIVMNADILSPPPTVKGGPVTGTLLAVIELSPASITIGVVAEYSAKPLLEVRVPAEAFFDLKDASKWHLDIGALPPKLPASVRFLSSFRADGYLMIHGDEIASPLRLLPGFAVAAGVRAAFTWGPEPIGLYLRISAKADVGISFKPMLLVGKVEIRGELHLFIVSIEASADAELIIFPGTDNLPSSFFVSAEVCGEVDFFFFSVSGCVKLELGSKPPKLPPAEPMVRALSLHSRSPALVKGTGGNGPVDGSLGDAAHRRKTNDPWEGNVPVVPIDAIPVLQFEMRPAVDPGCKFLGRAIDPKLPVNGWVRRGERYYRYTLKTMTLTAARDDGSAITPPVARGDKPNVWWDRHSGPAAGDDNEVQLALLNWIPDPTPAAAERTAILDDRVKRRWGDVCREVAPATRELWDVNRTTGGPSPSGWTLSATAWPDPAGTKRSSPSFATAHVSEPWRTGDAVADSLEDVFPAYVFGAQGGGRLLVAPRARRRPEPAVPGDDTFVDLFTQLHPDTRRLGDALRIRTGTLRELRLLLFAHETVGTTGRLQLQALKDNGDRIGAAQQIEPPVAQTVTAAAAYPPPFMDPGKPWAPLIGGATAAWTGLVNAVDFIGTLVQVHVRLPAATAQVEIGLAVDVDVRGPSWGILVFDSVTDAEVRRERFEQEERDRQIAVVDGALGADQAKRALLAPDATYTLTVGYDVALANADAQGNPDEKKAEPFHGLQHQFKFKTGKNPPERLDPWVMTTAPGQAEEHVFYKDPVIVVFSTPATRKLFKAYRRTLSAVVRAASGKRMQAPGSWDTIPPFARLPFESSLLSAMIGQTCVHPHDAAAHEQMKVTVPLDPTTEYLLDIEASPAASRPEYPLFQRRFNTSRYPSMEVFAADVKAAPVIDRAIGDLAPLTALVPAAPGAKVAITDQAFQELLRTLRWGDLTRPAQPRRTVIWAKAPGASAFGAVAVLLETPEPVWRFRDTPAELLDADGTKRWQLSPTPWLEVADSPAVRGFIRSTDGGRTLALLVPQIAVGGGTVALSLRRIHHPMLEGDVAAPVAELLAEVLRPRATWEGPH